MENVFISLHPVQTYFLASIDRNKYEHAILSITGSVKGVDPQGFVLVGGIAFAIAPALLPKKGQIVKIDAHLDHAPQAPDEQPVWTATSVIAFDIHQAQVSTPVEVPQRTDHHNTVATQAAAPQPSNPAQSSAAPTPTKAATPAAPTVRFGLPKQAPAEPASAKAIANQAVTAAAASGRFGGPAASGARPAASAPQSARPPFVASKDLDETSDRIPF